MKNNFNQKIIQSYHQFSHFIIFNFQTKNFYSIPKISMKRKNNNITFVATEHPLIDVPKRFTDTHIRF